MMKQLNAKINTFVFLQILCGIAWVLVSNYLWDAMDPLFTTVFPAIHSGLVWIGLSGIILAFASFASMAIPMMLTFIGTFMWIMSGGYRRGIGMIAFVMGIGILFGAFASHVKPLNEFDSMGYVMIARAVLALAVYFGIAAMSASQVLQWIAEDELRDPTVRIRYTHSIPLCTILPVSMLFIGYAPTMRDQFVALAVGSLVLIIFTVWTNRIRKTSWDALQLALRDAPSIADERRSRRIAYDRTTRRL